MGAAAAGGTSKVEWLPGDPIPCLSCLPLSWVQLHATATAVGLDGTMAYTGRVPDRISGADFNARYGSTSDSMSVVEPDRVYEVRAGLEFACGEDGRVRTAVALLRGLDSESDSKSMTAGNGAPMLGAAGHAKGASPGGATSGSLSSVAFDSLRAVGELMLQGHAAYSSIGLGCAETDRIVDALMGRLGPNAGVFGARVSGGGSGGTVAVLCLESAIEAVTALALEDGLRFGIATDDASKFPGLIL